MKTVHKMKDNYISLISVGFIVLVCMAFTGCAAQQRYEDAKQKAEDARRDLEDKKAFDTLNYVRQHKGEGTRRAMAGSEAELIHKAVKSMESDNFAVIQESHAVFGKAKNGSLSYAFYFYPSQTNDQTEVEVLIASAWLTAEKLQEYQEQTFTLLVDVNRQLLEKDFDPNVKRKGVMLPLAVSAYNENIELADKLIKKGAKVDLAIEDLKELASKNSRYLDRPANKNAYEKANSAIKLLESGVDKLMNAKREEVEKENNAFHEIVLAYQKKAVKPQLPEIARKYKVQAESAVSDKNFAEGARLFRQALEHAPWWPEGHFNLALILGEMQEFDTAIIEMKRYLALVPGAPNARAAQDKIYVWERKASDEK